MLVKFNSSKAGNMVMFAETARRLFEVMGKEGTARGVFTLEQLPDAIDRLRQAVAEEKAAGATADSARAGEDGQEEAAAGVREPISVSLSQRAYPLIELMERTVREKGYLVWEAAQDF